MNVGDLIGTGTISGPEPNSYGCLLELSNNGKNMVNLANGAQRSFLEDGDSVRMRGVCNGQGFNIGFGELVG